MVSIVTDIHLRDGAEGQWDTVMHERMTAVKDQPGWVGGQLLRSEDDPTRRVIVGTWESRADWERWHHDPEFAKTREELDRLVSTPEQHAWHDVVLDVRKAATKSRAGSSRRNKQGQKDTGAGRHAA